MFRDIQGAHKQGDFAAAQVKLNQLMDISRTLLEELALLEEEIESTTDVVAARLFPTVNVVFRA